MSFISDSRHTDRYQMGKSLLWAVLLAATIAFIVLLIVRISFQDERVKYNQCIIEANKVMRDVSSRKIDMLCQSIIFQDKSKEWIKKYFKELK
jgi:hypothetical protein